MTEEEKPHINGSLFIDCFISRMDNFCLSTGVTHRRIEMTMGFSPGWLNRVATKTLRGGEYYPNFTIWIFLDLLIHHPDLLFRK